MSLFHKDTPGKMNVVNPDADASLGLKLDMLLQQQVNGGYDGSHTQRSFLPRTVITEWS